MPGSDLNHGRIDADAAVAYALATNDPNESYLRGDAVPPLYTATLIHSAFARFEAGAQGPTIEGSYTGVHAGHEVRFLGPLRPGDHVHWAVTSLGLRQTSAGVLAARRIVVFDTNERPLVEHIWSSMYIGGTIAADIGPPVDDHAFPPDARERPVSASAVTITRDQSFRYAGASGDRNPHAVDDEATRREGFPRKILQGLCTFAMCSGVVVALAAGEPDRLKRLAGRFSKPVFLDQDLIITLYDAGTTADGARALAFEATVSSDGTTVISNGRAELAPD